MSTKCEKAQKINPSARIEELDINEYNRNNKKYKKFEAEEAK